jgi:hypothetical protein
MVASATMVQRSPLDNVKEELSFKRCDLTVTAGLASPPSAFPDLLHENSNAVKDNMINKEKNLVFIVYWLSELYLISLRYDIFIENQVDKWIFLPNFAKIIGNSH